MTLINVDSTIHVVSAAQAARMLGVKKETLYAYVSRGLITRTKSGYVRADVERLKARSAARAGHTAVAAGALRWGEPVLDSAITRIDPKKGPVYRGKAAIDLAREGWTFESVCDLLWQSQSEKPWPLRGHRRNVAKTMAGFLTAVVDIRASDHSKVGAATTADLVRARNLAVDFAGGTPIARAFLRACRAKKSGPSARRLVDTALVLVADHELNASSFAARVAASAGADLYACIIAALATLSGPRHGGESDRLEAFLREIGDPKNAKRAVLERTQRGELMPGFGHPLYPEGDPRAPPLLSHASRTLDTVMRIVDKELGLAPTIDCGLVAVSQSIGAPPGTASALFALGRLAGWVAHVMEQREAGFLLRPRARYTGV